MSKRIWMENWGKMYAQLYKWNISDLEEGVQNLDYFISGGEERSFDPDYQDLINKRVNSLKIERKITLEEIKEERRLLIEIKEGICEKCKIFTNDLIKFKKKLLCGECLNDPQGEF